MSDISYTAFFDRDTTTVDGWFTIQEFNRKTGRVTKLINRVAARSGQAGYTDTDWVTGQSPIPRGTHTLYTAPLNKGQDAGATGIGEFYPIDNCGDRTSIWTANRRFRRLNIGLHEENKWRGSAGCVVIVKDKDWEKVKQIIATMRKNKVLFLPLRIV